MKQHTHGLKQQKGEGYHAFQARIAEARAAQQAQAKERRRAKRDRIADRIDGYDRDDLGHSPDY